MNVSDDNIQTSRQVGHSAEALPKGPDVSSGALKVFISYARADIDIAADIELALRDKGFDVLIDQKDIQGGEDWRKRLGALILACDAIVLLLSESSAASPTCAWEVSEAARLTKRMLVITTGPLSPGVVPPPPLPLINWISCWRNPAIKESSFMQGVLDLTVALKTDLVWTRQLTQLQEQAERWIARGEAPDSSILLRGEILEEAKHWANSVQLTQRARTLEESGIKGDLLPASVAEFLGASHRRQAEIQSTTLKDAESHKAAVKAAEHAKSNELVAKWEREKAERRFRRLSVAALVAGVLLTVVSAIGGWFAWANLNEAQRQKADAAYQSAALLSSQARELLAQGIDESALLMSLHAVERQQEISKSGHVGNDNERDVAKAGLDAALVATRLALVIDAHKEEVSTTSLSRDGTRLATASKQGPAKIWDLNTGKLLYVLGSVGGCEFCDGSASFSPDGEYVVTVQQGATTLWNARTGTLIRTFYDPKARNNTFYAVFSTDGGSIITADIGSISKWDVKTGAIQTTFHPLSPTSGGIASLALLPDGKRLLVATFDGKLSVWSLFSGTQQSVSGLPRPTIYPSNEIRYFKSMTVHAGGERISTVARDGTLATWRLKTDGNLEQIGEQSSNFRLAVYSPDRQYLAISDYDGWIYIWDASTGAYVRKLNTGGLVSSLGIGGRDLKVVAGLADGGVYVWSGIEDLPTSRLAGIASSSYAVALSADGHMLATDGLDSVVDVWNAASATKEEAWTGHKDSVTAIEFSPDDELIVTGDAKGGLRAWERATGRLVWETQLKSDWVSEVSFSANGSRMLVAQMRGAVSLIETASGKKVEDLDGVLRNVDEAIFGQGNEIVIVSSRGNKSGVLDLGSGKWVARYGNIPDEVGRLRISPDGKKVIGRQTGSRAKIWDAQSGKPLSVLQRSSDYSRFEFSRDGAFVVGLGNGSMLNLWDTSTGASVATFRNVDAVPDSTGWLGGFSDFGFSNQGRWVYGLVGRKMFIWKFPDVLERPIDDKIRFACERLAAANAPLSFNEVDIAEYPALRSVPGVASNKSLRSPCRGLLPEETLTRSEEFWTHRHKAANEARNKRF